MFFLLMFYSKSIDFDYSLSILLATNTNAPQITTAITKLTAASKAAANEPPVAKNAYNTGGITQGTTTCTKGTNPAAVAA